MTPNKVIEQLDNVKPNAYSEEVKLGWISTLDGMVKKFVIEEDVPPVPYAYPDDMNKELVIEYPFDDVYCLYLASMVDFYNKEYGEYNNSAAMFDYRFTDYKKAYIREHRVKG